MTVAIASGSPGGLADVAAFLDELGGSAGSGTGFFDPGREIVVARAPGRLDLMGGIADYSGSLVLQWPLREAVIAGVQVDPEPVVRLRSPTVAGADRASEVTLPLDALAPGGRPLGYDDARSLFAGDATRQWAAYAAGALLVLMRERDRHFEHGLRLLVRSEVPEGKGVASSAAFEVAVMKAVSEAFFPPLDPRELAILCQTVENHVVGAPCGVMDQMASACGQAGELLALLCQPAELQGTIALPSELEVFGLDSGVRHAVSGSDYTGVRVGTFMGARIVAAERGSDDFLARLSPGEWESRYRDLVPEMMSGRAFLDRYHATADPVTEVVPGRSYAVRTPTAHPIYENFRVRTFAELLLGPLNDRRAELLGELMYQAHASYSACGLGSERTDLLVELAREAGPSRGFLGAKITGGGSGGTVAVLVKRGTDIGQIVSAFAARTGERPHVFSGSSPGAAAFGALRVRLT